MKKLLIFAVLSVFTLSSFNTTGKISEVEILYITPYKVTCKDGTVYYFNADVKLEDAQLIGKAICRASGH